MAEKSWSLGRALRGMFVKPTIDETTWEDLETALITADFGPDITEQLLDELHEKVDRYRTTDPRDLQRMLRETLEEHFAKFDTTLRLTERPAVVLVVGVNGVGKTTTIGKFAKFLQRYGRSVRRRVVSNFAKCSSRVSFSMRWRSFGSVVRKRSTFSRSSSTMRSEMSGPKSAVMSAVSRSSHVVSSIVGLTNMPRSARPSDQELSAMGSSLFTARGVGVDAISGATQELKPNPLVIKLEAEGETVAAASATEPAPVGSN